MDAQLASLLLREMPANVPTKDSTLAVGAKRVAAIPHPVTAKIPIHPFNPVSLAVAIAVVTNKNEKHLNFHLFTILNVFNKYRINRTQN